MHDMHEQRRLTNGSFVNVYGKGHPQAGQRLEPDHTGYGHEEYHTPEEARHAVRLRELNYDHTGFAPRGKNMRQQPADREDQGEKPEPKGVKPDREDIAEGPE